MLHGNKAIRKRVQHTEKGTDPGYKESIQIKLKELKKEYSAVTKEFNMWKMYQ